ncbi:MAG: NfeD family protein [Sulfuricurvum sp.]
MSYFIWLSLGVGAIVIEMMIPTLFSLFVGIGFFAAGIVAYFFPEMIFVQLATAAMTMVIIAILFRKRADKHTALSEVGTHNEFVGVVGKALTPLSPYDEGDVLFPQSVMSTRQWKALSLNEPIDEGTFVEIVTLSGNTLIVKSHL